MNKHEALAKIKELEEYIEKIDSKKDWPQVGEKVFSPLFNSYGSFRFRPALWRAHRIMAGMKMIFPDKETADLVVEIWDRAIELRENWRPDWKEWDQKNFQLIWRHDIDQPVARRSTCESQGTFHMPELVADKLIEEYGRKLKPWITGSW